MYKKNLIERIFLKLYYIGTSKYFQVIHKIQIGSNCKIEWSAYLRGNIKIEDNVSIGKQVQIIGNVTIGSFTKVGDFARLNTMPQGKIEIGKDCHINVFNIIGSSKNVIIKDYALFAAGVKITDATHGIDDVDKVIKKAEIFSQELLISENCWLGFDVNVIMGGKIGRNCVIGSKSLVNKEIPANSIAFGIPAKVIRTRERLNS